MDTCLRLGRFAFLVTLVSSVGCNLVTGADDIDLVGPGEGAGGATTGTTSTGTTSTGTGGVGGGGLSGGTGGSGASSTGGGAQGGAGGSSPCPPCGPHQHCEVTTQSCQCDPGFVMQGSQCDPVLPGDPSTRSQTEVCQAWADGHIVTTPSPLNASGADCDAGWLDIGGINDTLARLNMFRWLAGLGPTSDDSGSNDGAQLCANLESWWPWTGGDPHSPPASSKCYTPEGAACAGASNIAWGSGHPAAAINQFMVDNGNASTMGHRRWILNPPLGPVGIGFWQTGGLYGNAMCLRVVSSSGGGPTPPWVALPNQGFVPLPMAQWTWTFHGSLSGIPTAGISVLRVDDNTPLAVDVLQLNQGYAQAATSWVPNGWTAQAGSTYRVTVSGLTGGDVVYDVKPVQCN